MDTRILPWKDGKKAVFLLAFDDNAPTHLDSVIPELDKRHIVGTFYVITGSEHFLKRQNEWKNAALNPCVELANHTFTHSGATSLSQLEVELKRCNEVLYEVYTTRKSPRLMAFGRPGGVPWTVSEEAEEQSLQKFHLIKRPRFYGPSVKERSNAEITAEMIAIVDRALNSGAMEQLGFHGVGGDWHSTPLECFTALLDKLQAHQDEIWSTDPVSWHQYATERDAAHLTTMKANDEEIRLQLSIGTDPFFYDMPLTLGIKVPQTWTRSTVTQGVTQVTVPAQAGYVQCDVLPTSSEIVVQKSTEVL